MSADSYSLRELEAYFIKREVRRELIRRVKPEVFAVKQSGYTDDDIFEEMADVAYFSPVDFADADGVHFLCPKCFDAKGGPVGTHSMICWFTGKVADDVDPKPGRWNPGGTGIDDLTFVGPGMVSVKLTGGCLWHGLITNGRATLA